MKLNEQLKTVFTNLGIDTTSSEAQAILGNPSLANIEVAEGVSNKLSAAYFTLESAKANPEIRNAIKAEVLNGTDAEIERLMGKYEFDDVTKADIKKAEKTSKRLEMLGDKIKELTEKKSGATAATKDALNLKIEELNAEILKTKADYESKLLAKDSEFKAAKVNFELDNVYMGLEYALAAEKNISIKMAKALIEDVSKTKGLRFETTDTGIKILTKDNSEYFENNVKVTPQDYIKKTLTENKLIKVTATQTPENGQKTVTKTPAYNGNTSFEKALDGMIQNTQA